MKKWTERQINSKTDEKKIKWTEGTARRTNSKILKCPKEGQIRWMKRQKDKAQ